MNIKKLLIPLYLWLLMLSIYLIGEHSVFSTVDRGHGKVDFVHKALLFNTNLGEQDYKKGLLFWNTEREDIQFFNEESEIKIHLQDSWIKVYNNSGSPIAKNNVVYSTGTYAGMLTIGLAQADNISTTMVLGVTGHIIENNSTGRILEKGVIENVDTSSFSSNDMLFLSGDTAGAVEASPGMGAYICPIGIVITSHETEGTVLVKTIAFPVLNDQ